MRVIHNAYVHVRVGRIEGELYHSCIAVLFVSHRTSVFKDKEPRVLSANHQFRVVSMYSTPTL